MTLMNNSPTPPWWRDDGRRRRTRSSTRTASCRSMAQFLSAGSPSPPSLRAPTTRQRGWAITMGICRVCLLLSSRSRRPKNASTRPGRNHRDSSVTCSAAVAGDVRADARAPRSLPAAAHYNYYHSFDQTAFLAVTRSASPLLRSRPERRRRAAARLARLATVTPPRQSSPINGTHQHHQHDRHGDDHHRDSPLAQAGAAFR